MRKTEKTRGVEISTGELAELFGVSTQTIRNLQKEGTLIQTARGLFRMDESVRNYVAHLKGLAQRRSVGFDESKAREKAAKARIAEAQADLQEGKLLAIDDVAAVESSILSAMVARLCNFGDGVANVCHNQPAEFISTRVNDGLRSVLREVAKLPHVPESEKKKALQTLGLPS